MVVQFIVFLTLSTLICRGKDISKCFSESLGIRDNEGRLYIAFVSAIKENGHISKSISCNNEIFTFLFYMEYSYTEEFNYF